MSQSTPAGAQPVFDVRGVGLSTYTQGGYADSGVVDMIHEVAADGANYVEIGNVVLADLATATISDVIEKGKDQTASFSDLGRAIDAAHAAGLEVMLKPQVAVHDPAYAQYNAASWINMVDPDLVIANPSAFFANYKAYILQWATLAEQHHAGMLSIGNEMVAATKPEYTPYWNDIIAAVRSVYHGALTYSALAPLMTNAASNEITQIGFWGKLDMAGFDVYPSLVHTNAPTVADLAAGWRSATVFGRPQDYVAFLGDMAAAAGKPVLFTETGLPSFDGASNREATSDGDIGGGHAADQGEQADWWQAFFQVWAAHPPAWLKGVFAYNNDPGALGAYYDQNYNFNGKLAETVISAWYGGGSAIPALADGLSGGQADDQLYLYGPASPHAATQAASLSTTVSLTLTGSILGGTAPTIHVYLNGVDKGAIALKPTDSGVVDANGAHVSTNQTFTFTLPGPVPIDQLRIGFDSPAVVDGHASTTFFQAASVDGVPLTQASYVPAAGAGGPVAETMPLAGAGASVGQWAGGDLYFDATPWNVALSARAIGSPADPIAVQGGGGVDTVHVLGVSSQYVFSRADSGAVLLSEASGLGQNAVLQQVSAVDFSDGSQVGLGDLSPGIAYRFGGGGNDSLVGGVHANDLRGGAGNDQISSGPGADTVNGNMGDDTIVSQSTAGAFLYGGQGDDLVTTVAAGPSVFFGNLGSDTLIGGGGSETLYGGRGDDSLSGGAGADWISGDRGDDTLAGGTGADVFHTFPGAGLDRVVNFRPAEGDRVMVDPGSAYAVAQSGADVVIAMTDAQMVLVGVRLSDLQPGWIFGA